MQPPGRAKSSFFHDQPRPRRGINSCPAGTCGHEAPAGAGAGSKRSLGQPELLEQAAPGQRGRAERRESVACHWPGPWVWRLCFCCGGSSPRRKNAVRGTNSSDESVFSARRRWPLVVPSRTLRPSLISASELGRFTPRACSNNDKGAFLAVRPFPLAWLAGAAFQVLLEALNESKGFERRAELDLPGCVFGCMRALRRHTFG